jgi:hypothetical protein
MEYHYVSDGPFSISDVKQNTDAKKGCNMGFLSVRIQSLKIKVAIAEKLKVLGPMFVWSFALLSFVEQVPKIFPPISESLCIYIKIH